MRIHRTSAIKAIYGGNRNEKKGVPTVKAIPAFSMATVKPHAGGEIAASIIPILIPLPKIFPKMT
jgi:hypothetical protein